MVYDIAVIGAGVAGMCAVHRIIEKQQGKKKLPKIILFDIGRPPAKRRTQMFGFGGLLPNSDGKLYLLNTKEVAALIGDKKAKLSQQWVLDTFQQANPNLPAITKDTLPSASLTKKLKNAGYKIYKNDHIQLLPSHIHTMLRTFSDEFEKHIDFAFDQEIFNISKKRGVFVLSTGEQEVKCRQILIAVGRSGWRFCGNLFKSWGLIEENSIARYGIKIEMPISNIPNFNRSNCSMSNGQIEVGPFCYNGKVVPEDHYDFAMASFRSNEERWYTDKVSFNFIGNIRCENAFEQTDRIAQLTFIMANDRVSAERVSTLVNGRTKILTNGKGGLLPEYEWIVDALKSFGQVAPEILTKSYYHVPTLVPLPPKIALGTNMETEVEGMFLAGESAGIVGLLAAGETGMCAADGMAKSL